MKLKIKHVVEQAGITLALITLAEIGDKSQFVCMALAARYGRARPVIIGAIVAFTVLNIIAVLFGSTLASWLPQTWVLAAMAILFAVFGVQSLMQSNEDDDETDTEISGRSLFISAFIMIFVAELGDKTQISVAGLSGIYSITAVFIGATIALAFTSVIAVFMGKTILSRLPMVLLHRLAGLLFLTLSGLAVLRLLAIV